jgi:hypothetical protein
MRFFEIEHVKDLSKTKSPTLFSRWFKFGFGAKMFKRTLRFCLCGLSFLVLQACQEQTPWTHAVPSDAQLISNLPARQQDGQHQRIARVWMEYAQDQADWLYLYEKNYPFLDLSNMQKTGQTLYRGVTIQGYRDARGRNLVFAQLKGVCMLAAHAIMVEEAIRSLKSPSTDLQKLVSTLDWKHQETLLIGPSFNKKDRHFPVNRPYRGMVLQRKFGQKNWSGDLFFAQNQKKLGRQKAKRYWAQLQEATPADAWQIEPYWPDQSNAPAWMRGCKGMAQLAYLGDNPGSSACLVLAGKYARAWSKLTPKVPSQQELNYQAFRLKVWQNRALDPLGRKRFVAFFMQNTLVLASSVAAAERWIDAFVVGNTLAQKSPFSESTCNARLDPDLGLGAVMKGGLNLATYSSPKNSPFLLKGQSGRKTWHFSLEWAYPTENEALAWQITLDSPINGMWPLSTGKAVLVQTSSGELLCFNAEGKVKWRLSLKTPIASAPTAAQYGDYPALFFGAGKQLIGLDSSGHLLPGFPWAAETGSGLCVAGLNSYFFYSGKNGYVYGLDREGHPLGSWNPGPYAGQQRFPLQFFEADGQDFLLIRNPSNQLQVLDRDAQDHFAPIQLEGQETSPIGYQWTAKQRRIVVAEKGGRARVVGPDGQSFMLPLGLEGFTDTPQLLFVNVWGDERKDYLALGSKTLTLNGYEGQQYKLIRRKKLPFTANALFQEGANIGLSHLAQQQVWVLNSAWEMSPIFPVKATHSCFFPGGNLLVCAFEGRLFAIKSEQ